MLMIKQKITKTKEKQQKDHMISEHQVFSKDLKAAPLMRRKKGGDYEILLALCH